jgi:uncharacterized protein (DUF849 family)
MTSDLPVLVQACLNGARTDEEHPAVPRSPAELAAAGRSAVAAGARVLHLHAFDESGAETFGAAAVAATLHAVRAACPGVPISLTTSDGVEPHPTRLRSIGAWTDVPDLVTANQGEDGIAELCELLIARGVGIEAGLLSPRDAHSFVRSGLAPRCVRVLVEPLDADPADALAAAEEIETIVARAGVTLEQVHHGDGVATWGVMERALRRGHGVRAGLEDSTRLPDGTLARDNASLVALAVEMARRLVSR